uniref:Putative heat shock protein n=1 Tax=Trypanosoma congolense (strain IL3000) TaxID=1068625 RepID=G0UTN9_TRYCI|nr:putative heat shock protein [Trypanosoma congolense IL3000]
MFAWEQRQQHCLLLLLLLQCLSLFGGADLMAVDMGTDWTKAATLVSGSGVVPRANIVLNDQTNRKSPQCIAFRFVPYSGNDTLRAVERIFAEEAKSLEPRFPQQSICSPSLLAGLSVQQGDQARNEEREGEGEEGEGEGLLLPEDLAALTYVVVPQARRGAISVLVKQGENNDEVATKLQLPVEELLGMILGNTKRSAERSLGGEPIRYVTLAVPTSASLMYRQAMIDAAAVTGLRAFRLVHSSSAAALQLAHLNAEHLFSAENVKGNGKTKGKYVMLYDMGSSKTEVAVFRFSQAVDRESRGTITMIASAASHKLGGRAFDRCLAQYVERELFPTAKPTPVSPVIDRKPATAATRRAVVSLLRSVNIARERLSVNQNVPLIVPGVREDGGDFTANISRAVFENACSELFDEAVRLRDRALSQTNGTVRSLSELARLELIGGATRMPKLQDRLSQGYGKAADRTLNSDEAVVSGAALMSRSGSRKFEMADPLMNDVYITFSPPLDGSSDGSKSRRHLLFPKWKTTLPSARRLTFLNRTTDFTVTLQDRSGKYSRSVVIRGVNESINAAREKQQDLGTERKKKNTRSSTHLETTEVVVEITVGESGVPYVSGSHVRATYREETTFLSNVEVGEGGSNASQVMSNTSESGAKADEGHGNSTGVNETDSTVLQDEWRGNSSEQEVPESERKKATNEKQITLRFPVAVVAAGLTSVPVGVNMNKDEALASRDRLRAFQRLDDERFVRSALLNDIESMLLHFKSLDAWLGGKVDDNASDANVSDWRSVVTSVSQWFDEVGSGTNESEIQLQHRRLKELQVK